MGEIPGHPVISNNNMQTDPEFVKKVRELIVRKTGLPEEKVCLEARLLHDLGIDGDDAQELLLEFCAQFGVDSRDIKVQKYFGSEYFPLRFLRCAREARHREKEALKVEQLVIAAQLRKWIY